jgi:hypothetical protein
VSRVAICREKAQQALRPETESERGRRTGPECQRRRNVPPVPPPLEPSPHTFLSVHHILAFATTATAAQASANADEGAVALATSPTRRGARRTTRPDGERREGVGRSMEEEMRRITGRRSVCKGYVVSSGLSDNEKSAFDAPATPLTFLGRAFPHSRPLRPLLVPVTLQPAQRGRLSVPRRTSSSSRSPFLPPPESSFSSTADYTPLRSELEG